MGKDFYSSYNDDWDDGFVYRKTTSSSRSGRSSYGNERATESSDLYGDYSYGRQTSQSRDGFTYRKSVSTKRKNTLSPLSIVLIITAVIMVFSIFDSSSTPSPAVSSYGEDSSYVFEYEQDEWDDTSAWEYESPQDTYTDYSTPKGQFLYFRDRLSKEEQDIYDTLAAGIAAREDEISFRIGSKDRIKPITKCVCRDRQELFWWTGSTTYIYYDKNGYYDVVLSPEYNKSKEEIVRLQAQIDSICADVLDNLRYASDYEKVRIIHDFLIDRTIYDLSYHGTDISLFFTSGRGVCEGYARGFMYLMNQLGVPTLLATNEDHAWNLVCVDGKWYQIDVTWDDPVMADGRQVLQYDYFCLTDEEMCRDPDHICDYADELPACYSYDANYFVANGRYLQSYSLDTIRQWMAEDYPQYGKLSFKCANQQLYNEAVSRLRENGECWQLNIQIGTMYWNLNDKVYIISLGEEGRV